MCQALITHFNHPSYYNRYYRIKGKITTKPVLQKIGTKVKFFVMFAPVHAQYTLEAKTVTRKDRMIDIAIHHFPTRGMNRTQDPMIGRQMCYQSNLSF